MLLERTGFELPPYYSENHCGNTSFAILRQAFPYKEGLPSTLQLKNWNKLLYQILLTSGLKRAFKPLLAPSSETPKKNSIIRMRYGIVAVMYTAWKEIRERNRSLIIKTEIELTLRAYITFVLFQAWS